jgi:hypothetical protein
MYKGVRYFNKLLLDENRPTSKAKIMTDNDAETTKQSFLKKYRVHFFWFLLISVYFYRTMLPEVVFVNASGITVEQVKITIPGDDKIWRNIEHSKSKAFRFQPARVAGQYEVSIILADGTLIHGKFAEISPWDFGHKAFFELSPDLTLRADFNYSLFD